MPIESRISRPSRGSIRLPSSYARPFLLRNPFPVRPRPIPSWLNPFGARKWSGRFPPDGAPVNSDRPRGLPIRNLENRFFVAEQVLRHAGDGREGIWSLYCKEKTSSTSLSPTTAMASRAKNSTIAWCRRGRTRRKKVSVNKAPKFLALLAKNRTRVALVEPPPGGNACRTSISAQLGPTLDDHLFHICTLPRAIASGGSQSTYPFRADRPGLLIPSSIQWRPGGRPDRRIVRSTEWPRPPPQDLTSIRVRLSTGQNVWFSDRPPACGVWNSQRGGGRAWNRQLVTHAPCLYSSGPPPPSAGLGPARGDLSDWTKGARSRCRS